jgi:hypothetical protein
MKGNGNVYTALPGRRPGNLFDGDPLAAFTAGSSYGYSEAKRSPSAAIRPSYCEAWAVPVSSANDATRTYLEIESVSNMLYN